MEILNTITTKHRSGSKNLKWKTCVHALGKQQLYYQNMNFHLFCCLVKVAGFGPDHDISIDYFVETYGSYVSKCTGDEFYDGNSLLEL